MAVRNLDPDPGGTAITEDTGSKAWAYARATQLNIPGRGSMTKAELYDEAIPVAESLPYGRHLDSKEAAAEARELKIKGRSKMPLAELAMEIYKRRGWTPSDVPESARGSVGPRGRGGSAVASRADTSTDEFWPVVHIPSEETIHTKLREGTKEAKAEVRNHIVGYCRRYQYPAIRSALFMNANQVLPYLLGENVRLEPWERESFEMRFDTFQTEKPSEGARAVEDLPR